MKRIQIPDQQVKDAAEQFDNARRILQDQLPGSGTLLPLLNVTSVAIKLFLKSLSLQKNYVPLKGFDGMSIVHVKPGLKGHKLIELFARIPEEICIALENEFSKDTRFTIGLEEALRSFEGLFQWSRYPFEKEAQFSKYNLTLLMEFVEFLRTFIDNLDPYEVIESS